MLCLGSQLIPGESEKSEIHILIFFILKKSPKIKSAKKTSNFFPCLEKKDLWVTSELTNSYIILDITPWYKHTLGLIP